MARLLRFAAVAVLLGGVAAGVSGCTGDADPVVSVSPSVTAEATPSPSVSPSPTPLSEEELLELIPSAARTDSFAGASEFAKFFMVEYQRMFAGQDSALFQALSEPDCIFCNSALNSLREIVAAGQTIEGGEITVDDELAQGGLQDDSTYIATIRVVTAEQTTRDSAGGVVSTTPEMAGLVSVQMRRQGDIWVVVDVNLRPDGSA